MTGYAFFWNRTALTRVQSSIVFLLTAVVKSQILKLLSTPGKIVLSEQAESYSATMHVPCSIKHSFLERELQTEHGN